MYDLLVDGRLAGQASVTGGNVLTIDMATGTAETRPGPVGHRAVHRAARTRARTSRSGCRTTRPPSWSPCAPTPPSSPLPDGGRRVWLHHGSSISHGSDAASPTTTWPALAAALGGVELINLGLGGSALLDPFTARAMRDTPADLISVKIGINLVNTDLMRLRAFAPAVHGFLDTIREGHPDHPAAGRLARSVPDPRGHPRARAPRTSARSATGSSGSWPRATPRSAPPGS